MSNMYGQAGKGDTPRSCNSKSFLENYDQIKWRKLPDDSGNCPTENARRKEGKPKPQRICYRSGQSKRS